MAFILDVSSHPFAMTFACFLLILAFAYIWSTSRKLSKLPGPAFTNLTSYYRVMLMWRGEGPVEHYQLHEKYGPIVRIGPTQVLVSDPAMIPIIYSSGNKFLKSRFYDVFSPLYKGVPLDTIFSTRDPIRNRALKQPILTKMKGSMSIIEHSARTFIQAMYNRQEQSINFTDWTQYWAFDLTGVQTFGNYFGFMESGSDIGRLIYNFQTSIRAAAMLGQVPEWYPWTLGNNTLMRLLTRFASLPDVTGPLLQAVEEKVDAHDHMDHSCGEALLCKVVREHGSNMSTAQYTDVVNVLFETFLAGSAEVAVATSTVMYCLLNNPSAYQTLIQEIQSKNPPQTTNHITTHEDLLGMPYLDAVLKESMRLHPPNCPAIERLVPSGGISILGYYLPGGTNIAMSAYAVHRNTSIYGADANRFRPERWLDADPASKKLMEASFMAFGKGSRACTGRELGMLELRMFMVMVLRRFDIAWAKEDTRPWLKMYWLVEPQGLEVVFRARSGMEQPLEE